MGIVTKRVNEFPTPYTCRNAIQKGGPETKLSMILMGLGNFVHGQKIKGLLYLAVEVAYIVFMAVNGITFLSMLGGLGSVPQKEVCCLVRLSDLPGKSPDSNGRLGS